MSTGRRAPDRALATLGTSGSILDVFDARSLAISDEVREAIADCQDSAVLKLWHRRAITVSTDAEILTNSPKE